MLTALHFLTHIGLSWIVANVGRRSTRDRWLILLAGVLPDLDGIGILWSEAAYAGVHRAAGHGLLFIVLCIALTVRRADRPWSASALVALSFLLDLVGTGGLPSGSSARSATADHRARPSRGCDGRNSSRTKVLSKSVAADPL